MYKITFFGSDLFSLASFKAIVALRSRRPDLISDLSLVTRSLKPSGRGMKKISIPPIVDYAKEVDIPWRPVETSHDLTQLSEQSNLAIAVSYGMLIPGAYLNSLKFGGLNVHPSLLPQYRGSSPLQYAIADRKKYTGVTVQTLHPTKFDHGKVIWQSDPVEIAERETTSSLSAKLSLLGAQGLVKVLEQVDLLNPSPVDTSAFPPSLAHTLDKSAWKIDFMQSYRDTDAKGRALPKLYFEQRVTQKKAKNGKLKGHPVVRVNMSNFHPVAKVSEPSSAVGSISMGFNPAGLPLLALRVSDGYIGASDVTVQGFKEESPEDYISNLERRNLREVILD